MKRSAPWMASRSGVSNVLLARRVALLAPHISWPSVRPRADRSSITCLARVKGMPRFSHGHQVSPIHRKGVPSEYSKYLPARGPLLAARTNPWRAGLAAISAALHAAHRKLPFTPWKARPAEAAAYDHSPAAGAAKRAFHVLPPSQKPGTAKLNPLASPLVPVNVTTTKGLPPSGRPST